MAKKEKEGVSNGRDELATLIADSLNKQFKDFKVAYFLADGDAPTDVTEWISTGSSTLDLIISNRKNGGIPVGRITEIMGLEASGKSLLAAHLLAETQKKGGVAVYIDTESAVSQEFLQAIGVDINKLVYVQLQLIEDVFTTIENIIERIRTSSKDKLVTIVVDSVAAASTKVEVEADYDKDGWATTKAIVMSKAMRKINDKIARQRIAMVFTNQLREKLGVSFGDAHTTSGGKALGFHASVRLRLKAVGQIKKGEEVMGVKCRALVVKNRMGPPLRQAEYDMFFASGIDNYGGWLTLLKNHEVVDVNGAWYSMKDQNGKAFKFQAKDWATKLEEDAEFKDFVYQTISDIVVMKYKSANEVDLDALDIQAIKEGEEE